MRFRPPYPLDRNRIANAFGKPEALLRAAEERTGGGWWARLGRSLNAVAADGCRNDIRHAGYTAPADGKPL